MKCVINHILLMVHNIIVFLLHLKKIIKKIRLGVKIKHKIHAVNYLLKPLATSEIS